MVAASLRDIPLLGTLPKQAASLPERHLGLVLPDEVAGIDELLDTLADQLTLDLAAWDALPAARIAQPCAAQRGARRAAAALRLPLEGTRIAIARDAAFMFLYPANLVHAESAGRTTRVLFPRWPTNPVPSDATAVYLPGGYPELHCSGTLRWPTLASLAARCPRRWPAHRGGMRRHDGAHRIAAGQARQGLADGRPVAWPESPCRPVLPAWVHRRCRRRMVRCAAIPSTIRGWRPACRPKATTQKHPSGTAGEAVYRVGSLQASYFHGYFPSNPAAVAAMFSRSAA